VPAKEGRESVITLAIIVVVVLLLFVARGLWRYWHSRLQVRPA
jgi:hypothetical protein